MKMPERGKLQVFRVKKKNKRCEAYKMSPGNLKRNGWTNSYLFFMAWRLCAWYANKPTPVSNEATWRELSKSNKSYPPGDKLRKRKTAQFAASLREQQNLIHRTTSTAERLTEASCEIAWILARRKENILRNSKRLLFGFSRNIVHRLWQQGRNS